MPHLHHPDAKRTRGDKLEAMTGERGRYPPEVAAERCGTPRTSASAQGDAARTPPENFAGAPARQVGDQGTVKGD